MPVPMGTQTDSTDSIESTTEILSIHSILNTHKSESGDLIQEFYNTFLVTGDKEYLDSSICLTEELVSSAPSEQLLQSYQALLDDFLAIRDSPTAGIQGSLSNITDTSGGTSEGVALSTTGQEISSEHEGGKRLSLEIEGSKNTSTEAQNSAQQEITNGSPELGVGMNPDQVNAIKENAELLDTFRNMFEATNDIEYLHNAIGLAKDLVTMDERFSPLLYCLLRTRDSREPGPGTERSNQWSEQLRDKGGVTTPPSGRLPNETLSLDATSKETFECIMKLLETYARTNEVHYLNDAVHQAAQLSLSDKGILPILGQMLKMQEARSSEKTRNHQPNCPQRIQGSVMGQFSFSLRVSRESHEKLEQIETLMNMYMRGMNIDDLNNAISLAENIALQDNGIQPLLDHMLKIRAAHNEGLEPINQDKMDVLGSITQAEGRLLEWNCCSCVNVWNVYREELDVIFDFEDIFKATGDTKYLDSAIEGYYELVSRTVLNEGDSSKHERERISLNLSIILYTRYNLFETNDDLEKAIKFGEEAAMVSTCKFTRRKDVLHHLSLMLRMRYLKKGVIEDLDNAINRAEEIRNMTTLNTPDRAETSNNVGVLFRMRYERLEGLEDLDLAIERIEEAVAPTPYTQNGPNYAAMIDDLASLLSRRYMRSGAVNDIQRSVTYSGEAISLLPIDHPYRSIISSNLCGILLTRFKGLGDLKDLDQAVDMGKEAVATVPQNYPTPLSTANNFTTALLIRYNHLGGVEDLMQAVKWAEREMETAVASEKGITRAQILNNLGLVYFAMYNHYRDIKDLEKAIKYTEDALQIFPRNHPSIIEILSSMSKQRLSMYLHSGSTQELELSVNAAEEAVVAAPSNSTDQSEVWQNLSAVLRIRHGELGATDDLQHAIKRAEDAFAAAAPVNGIRRASICQALSMMFHRKFNRFGDLEDLDRAEMWIRQALDELPSGDVHRAILCADMGGVLRGRFGHSGDLDDLEQAITWAEEAARLASPNSSDRLKISHDLATSLEKRYERLGAAEDLTRAITCAEGAIKLAPEQGPHRVYLCSLLASLFQTKYTSFEVLEDLENAIRWATEAVNRLSPDDPDRPMRFSNLSSKLLLRGMRFVSREDFDEAVKFAEMGLKELPSDHASLAEMSARLSYVLRERYSRFGALKDLEGAIAYAEEAVARAPLDMNSSKELSIALELRYLRFGAGSDLDRAIERIEAAVTAIPPDHPRRASYLLDKGSILFRRYSLKNTSRDFYQLLRVFYEAWYCHTSTPHSRIISARNAARLLTSKKKWQEASSMFENAVKMLPRLSSRSFMRGDQQYLLSDFAQLAAETVSVALKAGEETAYCLRLLELGRGVIMGLMIDRRSDPTELRLKHPDLFKIYDDLRTEIDCQLVSTSDGGDDFTSPYQKRIRRREQVLDELEDVLTSIRELPGFEGFQLPPRSQDLMAMAHQGPIVVMNSTAFRSDAIIVTSSIIQLLPLPQLSYKSVCERMNQIPTLVRGKRKTFAWRNERMEEILLWLWDVAVEPVLNALKLEPVTSNMPHIWWVGVGHLAMAPFHAAGDHSPKSTRNTISRAISSYIPTIKALSYARERKLELLSRPDSRLLLVNMPTTPGHRKLPHATQEIESIVDIVEGKTQTTRLDHPSADEVLKKLNTCQAVHFACHGVSDVINPSGSHLILHDGGKPDKLSVETLSHTNNQNAQIAYLSACSTAENGSKNLPDESIYIASGFQLAGFSHVLATQWVSNDGACRQVAGDFYRHLFSPEGAKDGGHWKVGAAFHSAVGRLRRENLEQPLLWAPFIHTGA